MPKHCSEDTTKLSLCVDLKYWRPIKYCINFKIANINFYTLFLSTCLLTLQFGMLFVPLVLGCHVPICCPLHMSVVCLVPAVSALQLLQSGILYLRLSECVRALIPSAITSRPTVSIWPSNPLAPSSCASHSASGDHCAHLKIILYLLTY